MNYFDNIDSSKRNAGRKKLEFHWKDLNYTIYQKFYK